MKLLYPFLCLVIAPFSYAFFGPPANKGDLSFKPDTTAFRIGRDIYNYGSDPNNVTVFGIDENNNAHVKYEDVEDLYFMCKFCFSFVMSDNSVLTLTGYDTSNDPNGDLNRKMGVYYFDPISKTINGGNAYKSLPGTPGARIFHQAVITPDKKSVYVFGGLETASINQTSTSILQFDIVSSTFINHGNISYVGGSATMLPSGIVVLAFGSSTVNQPYGNILYNTSSVFLFDTNTNKLSKQNISGTLPLSRTSASGTLGPDNAYIYYFGGNNFDLFVDPQSYMLGEYGERLHIRSDLVVLNTNSWEWYSPDVSGPPPGGRYDHFSLLYEDNTIIVGGGTSRSSDFRYDFSVLRNIPYSTDGSNFDDLEWFTNSAVDNAFSKKLVYLWGPGKIAALALGTILGFLFIFGLCWKGRMISRSIICKRRLGDPGWTEILQVIIRIILAGILIAYIVYAIILAINSASINEERIIEMNKMPIPDILVCMGILGEFATRYDVSCRFQDGQDCSDYFYPITNETLFPSLNQNIPNPVCQLFAPPQDIYFQSNDGTYEYELKDLMHVNFYKRNVTVSSVSYYVTYYTSQQSPYRTFLGLNTDDSKMSIQDAYDWIEKDESSSSMANTFSVNDSSIVTAEYSLTDTRTLTNSNWNYFGFAGIYDISHDITQNVGIISVLDETNSIYNPSFTLDVKPSEYTIRRVTEQKVSTILGGLASAGGVFSVIIAFEALLFGFRPNSPWGIVQRWSWGGRRKYLKEKLRDKFNTSNVPVPMTTRVRDDLLPTSFNSTAFERTQLDEDVVLKVRKMEERMQLMEDIFKEYYIDDEIFQKLHEARDTSNNDQQDANNGTSLTIQEDEEMSINQNERNEDSQLLS